MASSTVENYLKQIYLEQQSLGPELVPMGRLATAMAVTPGTATTMIKALAEANLVNYEPRSGVRLTRPGEQLALHVLRRHRLVELFLVKMLGLDWSEVHEEAEHLEHAVSDKVLERMDALLGHPSVDPHGDPIPTPELTIDERDTVRLQDMDAGDRGVFVRISDSDPEMLRYLGERGIAPGDRFEVVEKQPFAGPVFVRFGGETHVLGGTLAQAMRVEVAA